MNQVQQSPSGGDDCEVWLWETSTFMTAKKAKPRRVMNARHLSNIFSLGFSVDGGAAYSAGNDGRFLAHDVETGATNYKFSANSSIHRIDPHVSFCSVYGTEES